MPYLFIREKCETATKLNNTKKKSKILKILSFKMRIPRAIVQILYTDVAHFHSIWCVPFDRSLVSSKKKEETVSLVLSADICNLILFCFAESACSYRRPHSTIFICNARCLIAQQKHKRFAMQTATGTDWIVCARKRTYRMLPSYTQIVAIITIVIISLQQIQLNTKAIYLRSSMSIKTSMMFVDGSDRTARDWN